MRWLSLRGRRSFTTWESNRKRGLSGFILLGVNECAKINQSQPMSGGEDVLKTILIILQVLSALGLIAFVLLQSGKSAGLSGSIAGAGQEIFGKKKGLDELFSKVSLYCAIAFMVLTLALALV